MKTTYATFWQSFFATFSTVFGSFLSLITGDCLLSAIFIGDPLSPIIVASDGPLSDVFDNHLLFLIPFASLQALFLPNIPYCAHCLSLLFLPFFYFSLPFLPMPLIYHPTLFIRKRMFDQAFIVQKLITSRQQ